MMTAKRIGVILILLLWGWCVTAAEETVEDVDREGPASKPAPATEELPLTDDSFAPILVVEGGLVRDFGEAEKGDIEHAQFVFRNDGPSILKIRDVKTDCGCLTPEVPRKELQKGERGVIEVKVITSILEGKAENKHIIVYSNDPRYPHGLQLQVTGMVVSTVGITPEGVVFDGVRPESGAVRVVEVYDLRNIGFKVTKVQTSTPALAVRVEEAQVKVKVRAPDQKDHEHEEDAQKPEAAQDPPEKDSPEAEGQEDAPGEEMEESEDQNDAEVEMVEKTYRGYRIEVRLTEEAQVGKLEGFILITTDYERRPVWPVQVVGSLSGPFSHSPEGTMYLGSTQMGKTTRRGGTIVIKALEEGFAVSRAVATDPALTLDVEREGDTTRVRVRAKGDGHVGRHPARGQQIPLVLVFQEGKEMPIIRVPVTWRVRGTAIMPVENEGEGEGEPDGE